MIFFNISILYTVQYIYFEQASRECRQILLKNVATDRNFGQIVCRIFIHTYICSFIYLFVLTFLGEDVACVAATLKIYLYAAVLAET
jgi:hypothetical protein